MPWFTLQLIEFKNRHKPEVVDGVGVLVTVGVIVLVGVIDIVGVTDGVLLGVLVIDIVGVGVSDGGTSTTVFEYPLCIFGQHCLSLKYQFPLQITHKSIESIVIWKGEIHPNPDPHSS